MLKICIEKYQSLILKQKANQKITDKELAFLELFTHNFIIKNDKDETELKEIEKLCIYLINSECKNEV